MKSNRREFIKISSLGVGAIALTQPVFGWLPDFLKEKDPVSDAEAKRYPTYCEICFWKCAGWTYTKPDGSIWKIVGNEEDQHSNGRFCPRGTGGVGMYYDEDRLKTPLIREEKDGVQSFRKASWEEAFDLIASKMKTIASDFGPESMALFAHGCGGTYFTHLLKAFGSSAIASPSYAQCRGPRDAAFIATFGSQLGNPEPLDIRDSSCIVLIGSHLGENMHNGQVQELSEAIDKGISIITVDPRFSTVASKSKFWLPIKPSTDLALLLSWIHVLIYEEGYDKEYVEKYTYGFDQLKAHVKDMTPEWAYGITTIKPDVIRSTAREMAKASPAVIVHPGRHVTWYGDDTQRMRAVAILNALLGSWGRRGGYFRGEKVHLPEYPSPKYPEVKRSWREDLKGRYPLAGSTLSNTVVENTIPGEGKDFLYKGWIVLGTNLVQTLPDIKQTEAAIQNLDLLVVIDTMPMEITGYADIILPEATYLERWDEIRVSPHRKPQIALRMPAAEPKWDTKPAWWMAKQIGERLGLSDYFNYNSYEDVLDWQLKQMGSSLEEMKVLGVKTWEREADDLFYKPGEEVEFNTNTGKIELFSTDLLEKGLEPLPVYTAHPEPPEGFYRLIYGRAPMHTFSRTANNPNLSDLMDENSLWVNPKVAKQWGFKKDQQIWLENQHGVISTFPIKVRITERIRWDSVYMVHGFGHDNQKLTRTFGRGASDSQLITNVMIDPAMGGTGMRGNFVTFHTENPNNEKEVEL